MIAATSQGVTVAVGVWLIGIGVFMLIQPLRALSALARMGGSATIHIGEMGLRILAGAAIVLAAAGSRFPLPMMLVGGFLIASAIVLLILPRRWHAAYSTWWSGRIPVPLVRLIAPVSWAMGATLIWVVL